MCFTECAIIDAVMDLVYHKSIKDGLYYFNCFCFCLLLLIYCIFILADLLL